MKHFFCIVHFVAVNELKNQWMKIEQLDDQEGEKWKKKRIKHIKFTVSDFNGMKEIKGVDMQIITILIWDFDEFFLFNEDL